MKLSPRSPRLIEECHSRPGRAALAWRILCDSIDARWRDRRDRGFRNRGPAAARSWPAAISRTGGALGCLRPPAAASLLAALPGAQPDPQRLAAAAVRATAQDPADTARGQAAIFGSRPAGFRPPSAPDRGPRRRIRFIGSAVEVRIGHGGFHASAKTRHRSCGGQHVGSPAAPIGSSDFTRAPDAGFLMPWIGDRTTFAQVRGKESPRDRADAGLGAQVTAPIDKPLRQARAPRRAHQSA